MILLAGEGDPVLPDADDRSDDPDAEMRTLKRASLLDVGLEISDMAASLGNLSRTVGKPGSANRLAQGPSVGPVACRVDLLFGDIADIRAAAEEMAEMTFFVAPASDLHRALDAWIVIDHPRRFERVNNAKGAVEPAGEVLALQMRARKQL